MAAKKEKRDSIRRKSNGAQSLADSWIKKAKSNKTIAAGIFFGTTALGIVQFWDAIAKFYGEHVESPVELAAFTLAETSDIYFKEANFNCKFDSRKTRAFLPAAYAKENRALSLDFVFTNRAKNDAIFDKLDMEILYVGQVAGGTPGVLVPNHVYIANIKHETGLQSFPLAPAYRIQPGEAGAFSVAFVPETKGIGLCWEMRAIFHSNLGKIKSEVFSIILSNF